MEPIDGQDANRLIYYKDNEIPHTYQCSKCATFMGQEPNDPSCIHKWIIRDISKLNGTENETGDRDSDS